MCEYILQHLQALPTGNTGTSFSRSSFIPRRLVGARSATRSVGIHTERRPTSLSVNAVQDWEASRDTIARTLLAVCKRGYEAHDVKRVIVAM